VEGTYYLNRLFATVEMIPKTVVEVGNVGVVVSYTGETGEDLSGKEYRHGELVRRGSAACGANRSCPANTPSTYSTGSTRPGITKPPCFTMNMRETSCLRGPRM
jgi:hypothetical protein